MRSLAIIVFGLCLAIPAIGGDFTHSSLDPGVPTNTGYDFNRDQVTQNADPVTITTGNSVSCNAGGLHTDNSYMRRFDLNGDHGITDPWTLQSIDFGIEQAVGAGGSQPIDVNIYVMDPNAPLLFANLFLFGGATNVTVPDQSLTIFNVDFPDLLLDPVGLDVVVEVFTPNGQTAGNSFFVGSNANGQIRPTYLAAVDCGVSEPTDTAVLGFPGMHWVLILNGTGVTPVEEGTWGTVKALYR